MAAVLCVYRRTELAKVNRILHANNVMKISHLIVLRAICWMTTKKIGLGGWIWNLKLENTSKFVVYLKLYKGYHDEFS